MLRFVIQKMLNKKWMVLALLIGNILLVGIAASNPMYTDSVLQRTLRAQFSKYIEENNKMPLTITMRMASASAGRELFADAEAILSQLDESFGLPVLSESISYSMEPCAITTDVLRADREERAKVGMLTGMNDHISLVAGTGMSDTPDADGIYDGVVSEQAFRDLKLVLGEVLTFDRYKLEDGSKLRVRVAGVFKNSEDNDPYWVQQPNAFSSSVMIGEKAFRDLFFSRSSVSVTATWFKVYDHTEMLATESSRLLAEAEEYSAAYDSKNTLRFYETYTEIFREYLKTETKVRTTFMVLQVPVFVLLAAFIFMVSKQLLDMEQAEISVMKSRGASRVQIIGSYLLESVILMAVSVLIGLPIAYVIVRILGSANAFLEFVRRKNMLIRFSMEAIRYALIAGALSILAMVLPVFRHSKVTIVNQKQSKHKKSQQPLWQKIFLDVIILGISAYGLYTFNNQKELLAQRVIEGQSLDPLLFLSSSLFMLGAGLLALRILPLIVRFIFTIFKERWSPAVYTAFVRVLRTRKQQGFIMVFLVMTIAIGVFDASAARTINNNDETNLRYLSGADVTLMENWESNALAAMDDPSMKLTYYEPDFGRYESLQGAESITKVFRSDDGVTGQWRNSITDITVMGIETKKFGETIRFDSSLLPNHINEYLNAMAGNPEAVVLSANFRDKYNFKLGDAFTYRLKNGRAVRGVIVAFVNYWPGYAPVIYEQGDDGLVVEKDHFLIAANLQHLQNQWGVMPYEVWIKAKDSTAFVYEMAAQENLTFAKFSDTTAQAVAHKNDAVLQGTNGILTVGFIIVLLLCTVGFLIYWILSIRSRELQFGIFRAMGMSMREIISMLLVEHLFISGGSILAGVLVGILTGKLFMPLIQIAYSSAENVVPLRVVSESSDFIRLGVIVGLMIVTCLFILAFLIRKLRIAQALKLGED